MSLAMEKNTILQNKKVMRKHVTETQFLKQQNIQKSLVDLDSLNSLITSGLCLDTHAQVAKSASQPEPSSCGIAFGHSADTVC